MLKTGLTLLAEKYFLPLQTHSVDHRLFKAALAIHEVARKFDQAHPEMLAEITKCTKLNNLFFSKRVESRSFVFPRVIFDKLREVNWPLEYGRFAKDNLNNELIDFSYFLINTNDEYDFRDRLNSWPKIADHARAHVLDVENAAKKLATFTVADIRPHHYRHQAVICMSKALLDSAAEFNRKQQLVPS